MPRLVLFGDDGSTRFSCEVSESNANLVATFIRNHLAGPLQALVVVRRAMQALFPDPGPELLGPPPAPRKRRRPVAPTTTVVPRYTPPRKSGR